MAEFVAYSTVSSMLLTYYHFLTLRKTLLSFPFSSNPKTHSRKDSLKSFQRYINQNDGGDSD